MEASVNHFPDGPCLHSSTNRPGARKPDFPNHRATDQWNIRPSRRSLRTKNLMRDIIQNTTAKPNPEKPLIKLSMGDPTAHPELAVSDALLRHFASSLETAESDVHGYSHSTGLLRARESLAANNTTIASPLCADDVILTAGTSGAMELVLGAIADEGDNILLPCPGFPLTRMLAEHYGIECRYYQLQQHNGWQIHLKDLHSLADENTKAIVVNNPSNPCGSVFPPKHVRDVCAAAAALRLPVVADEVYAGMAFAPNKFVSFGQVSDTAPVLCVGGASKAFNVPGWRLGWVLIHDRGGVLRDAGIYHALNKVAARMFVPNTPAQAMLPTLLQHQRQRIERVVSVLKPNALLAFKLLSCTPGLYCSEPQGAMYMMARIDAPALRVDDDVHFAQLLLQQQSVAVMPGVCFQAANLFRIVLTVPAHLLAEACARIDAFCRHRVDHYDNSRT